MLDYGFDRLVPRILQTARRSRFCRREKTRFFNAETPLGLGLSCIDERLDFF
jgi:hypothetical protein